MVSENPTANIPGHNNNNNRSSVEQIRKEVRKIVVHHWEDDLSESDRCAIQTAQRTLNRYFAIGGLAGLGLGLLGARGIRASRTGLLRALRADARPSHVVFPSGRTGNCFPAYSPLPRFHCFDKLAFGAYAELCNPVL